MANGTKTKEQETATTTGESTAEIGVDLGQRLEAAESELAAARQRIEILEADREKLEQRLGAELGLRAEAMVNGDAREWIAREIRTLIAQNRFKNHIGDGRDTERSARDKIKNIRNAVTDMQHTIVDMRQSACGHGRYLSIIRGIAEKLVCAKLRSEIESLENQALELQLPEAAG